MNFGVTGLGRAVGCIIERCQIVFGSAAGCLWIDVLCVPFRTRNRAALVGIGLNQARIHGITFASDQARRHASADDALEHAPKDVAVTETLIAGTRERRVIRNLVLKAQPTEPSVRQVDPNVPTQRPLRSNGKDVADDEHPDHQHRID